VFTYSAICDVPAETLMIVSGRLAAHRRRIGTRAGRRAATVRVQAKLVARNTNGSTRDMNHFLKRRLESHFRHATLGASASPACVDACLGVAEEADVAVALYSDTLNEFGLLADIVDTTTTSWARLRLRRSPTRGIRWPNCSPRAPGGGALARRARHAVCGRGDYGRRRSIR